MKKRFKLKKFNKKAKEKTRGKISIYLYWKLAKNKQSKIQEILGKKRQKKRKNSDNPLKPTSCIIAKSKKLSLKYLLKKEKCPKES